MDDDGIDADGFQQHDILGKIARSLWIAHRMAAIFDDKGLARITLHIGQCLGQRFGLGEQFLHLGSMGRWTVIMRRALCAGLRPVKLAAQIDDDRDHHWDQHE